MTSLNTYLRAFLPHRIAIPRRERTRGAIGGGIGILVAALSGLWLSHVLHLSPWLVAPIGASAVLVFATPASPLAQPWSVVVGNTVTAIAGLIACNFIPDPLIAASVAVALAIAFMFATQSLHPPGGAMALLVVLTHTRDPMFALFPAFTNSAILVATGAAYHALTRHNYPHIPAAKPASPLLTEDDFAAALAAEPDLLDIELDDLRRLPEAAERHAHERTDA